MWKRKSLSGDEENTRKRRTERLGAPSARAAPLAGSRKERLEELGRKYPELVEEEERE
jgi:hypothetical protein